MAQGIAFNSDEYSWIDISGVAGGRVMNGLRGIKYGEKIEREFLYAKGGLPHAIQNGNTAYEGELKVVQSELEAFIRSSKANSILDLVLDTVTVAYEPNGGQLTTDQCVHVVFMESFKELNQGDKFMEVTLPVMFLRLKQNI